jgi:hypothetical protein
MFRGKYWIEGMPLDDGAGFKRTDKFFRFDLFDRFHSYFPVQ